LSILDATVTQKLDQAGTFKVKLPLTDPRAAAAQVGRIWKHTREGEGFVFAGLIEDVNKQPEDVLEISGPTLLAELLYKNTLLARLYNSEGMGAIIDGLLSDTAWRRLGSDLTSLALSWVLTDQDGWAIGGLSLKPAAWDAIGQDANSVAYSASASALAWTHTIGVGGKILQVGVAIREASRTVSGAVWGLGPATSHSSGPNSVLSSATLVNDSTYGTVDWTAPTNAQYKDGALATVSLAPGVTSHVLKSTGYGFNIPSSATITGIKVEAYVKAPPSGGSVSAYFRIIKGGTIGSTVTHESVGQYAFYAYGGGSSSMWGLTWTPAQINASDFGFALYGINGSGTLTTTLYCDHVRVTVYYTSPETYALTLVGAVQVSSKIRLETWEYVDPPAGTGTITVTLSGAAAVNAGATSWLGVDTTTPHGAFVSASGSGATAALVVPTGPGEVVTDFLAVKDSDGAQPSRIQNAICYELVAASLLCASSCDWRGATMSCRFDGESMLKALLLVLAQDSLHLREAVSETGGALVRQLEAGVFGTLPSGIVLMGGQADEELFDAAKLAAIESIEVEDTITELWNWIIPLGAGAGALQLTLASSTRVMPYTIQTMTGPDGNPVYYIADAASIALYGQRERVMVAKDIVPASTGATDVQNAANALYDLAASQLQRWWSQKQTAYKLTVTGLDPAVKPGDSVRVRWRGYALQQGTKYVYLDINDDLYILERTRRFPADGTEHSDLVVSNLDRALQTPDDSIVAQIADTVRSFRTHPQTW
jgi:hypothetical protein